LHLRPMINLKTSEGAQLFKDVAQDIATLVKKYNGSLSGEHGDGRLRGEFISQMVGDAIYKDFKDLKTVWDKNGIFNPGKIVDSPPMNKSLRYTPEQNPKAIETAFDFSDNGGFLESTELCNGSGDCRKTELSGGIMCPSYMATRDEMHTTRSRANMLRELMTQREEKAFNSPELAQSMELCLMCKGCKVECPSNVDMATFKSEFLFQRSLTNKPSFGKKRMAYFSENMAIAQKFGSLANIIVKSPLQNTIKKILGISPMREIPLPAKVSLFDWYQKNALVEKDKWLKNTKQEVIFFCDEFTNYLDVETGITALRLLWCLGYDARIINHRESGRTAISKGFLDVVKIISNDNVTILSSVINSKLPLVGIEPSTILTFRDEYPKLVNKDLQNKAKNLAKHTFLIEEFLSSELDKGNISSADFNDKKLAISLHGHCHQKALSSVTFTKKMLNIPRHYSTQIIPSGCCGMAGSFGYEHYDVSMKIGELVLFPAIRSKGENVEIAAPGTSCRQQIKDGVQVNALHPVELLWKAIIKS